MAKKKNKKKAEDSFLDEVKKPLIIVKAAIKDGYCHYGYKVQTGVNVGDKNDVKGAGLVHPDMYNAFRNLNVHLAVIDDAFTTAGEEVENVDAFHESELAGKYDVDAFEIKGEEENETSFLKGTKVVKSVFDRISLTSPKIAINMSSNYKWYNELKAALELCRTEVEEYIKGKHGINDEPVDENANQLTISPVDQNDVEDLEAGKL